MASQVRSPAKGVHYFQHFPKNFLRPYGEAGDAPNPDVMFRRLAAFNCEWLARPNIALSELADTLKTNMNVLENSSIMDPQAVRQARFDVDPLLQNLAVFDGKSNQREERATKEDLHRVVERFLTEKAELEQFFNDAIKVGGALYTMGIHFKVADTLLNNPEQFAQLSRNADGADNVFKKQANLPAMMAYLEQSCIRNEATSEVPRRNLLEELRQMGRVAPSRLQNPVDEPPVPAAVPDQSDEDSEQERRAARRAAKRARRSRRSKWTVRTSCFFLYCWCH